jgi:hydrogenase maturation protease
MQANSSRNSDRIVEATGKKLLLIGIGNEFRCDDAVGLLVARDIQSKNFPFMHIREQSGEGVALMGAWEGFDHVILIDAVSSGGEPGKICRIEARTEKVPLKYFHYSTHAFGVAEAVELARALGKLPTYLVLYGIEGKNFSAGTTISSIVRKGTGKVIEQIVGEIGGIS